MSSFLQEVVDSLFHQQNACRDQGNMVSNLTMPVTAATPMPVLLAFEIIQRSPAPEMSAENGLFPGLVD